MKNGTPSSAVIMPTGISCGASRVLAKRSEMSRTVAPVSMLSGMSFLCRQEKSFLAMCGEINPANEIMPPEHTAQEEARLAPASTRIRRRLRFSPSETAVFSPLPSMSRYGNVRNKSSMARTEGKSRIKKSSQFFPLKLPIVHTIIE